MQEALDIFLHLKQTNQNDLSNALAEHQQQVIESLGGFANMIELCLNNPCASEYIDTECKEFETFKQMLGDKFNNQNTWNLRV